MKIPFWKMHGAGNDFILVDDRNEIFPASDCEWLQRVASRRTGVGCEGVILVQESEQADCRMRFFNPDGSEVEMCGNGARCLARFAERIGAAPGTMSIDTVAGLLQADVDDDTVTLTMTDPKDWRMEQDLDLDGTPLHYSFVNSGVPHAVVEVEDLENCDVQATGSGIRYHSAFSPAGTNANFIKVTSPQSLLIRTYERGVEAETLACGTGVVASALVAARLGRVSAPVSVTARSGDVLAVDFTLSDDSAVDVKLTGPAVFVFEGILDY
ncbi:MAG: diaminopimelate epimerase [Lentisphaerae bacterium]|nr:diaminopimelate epimerase [Lentisphaerota bacterium]